jgi:hypothetical protein
VFREHPVTLREKPVIPPKPDYKMLVGRPDNSTDYKLIVAAPDNRYDYKILTPRSDVPVRSRPRKER